MKTLTKSIAITLGLCASITAGAGEFDATIPMHDRGAATYYVPGQIQGLGDVEFMVDTGSGYLAINEVTLKALQTNGQARYVKKLTGILANGTEVVVPVYAIGRLELGGKCAIENVEAAVFPGKTRFILGLSALAKASPFIFSVDPPQLVLSHCMADAETPANSEKVAARE